MDLNIMEMVRQKVPLVHFITNYVTVNDCANMTLAAGGSPIMADELREVTQITGLCSALVLNMGTPNERTVQSMLEAGKEANRRGVPVILDPVGAGTSRFRDEIAATLLAQIRFSVIKGNISEIQSLAGKAGTTRGVDAQADALSSEVNLAQHMELARNFAVQTGAVVAITGPIDVVSSAHEVWSIENGHPMMAKITGTGCMSAAVMAVHVGACSSEVLPACVCAMTAMGVCGELAYERLKKMNGGTGSYRMLLLDSMSILDESVMQERGRAMRETVFP